MHCSIDGMICFLDNIFRHERMSKGFSPDGLETAVAEFDEDYKKFVLCK